MRKSLALLLAILMLAAMIAGCTSKEATPPAPVANVNKNQVLKILYSSEISE